MMIKKIICLTMVIAMILCVTACKSTPASDGSEYIETSTITEIYDQTQSPYSSNNDGTVSTPSTSNPNSSNTPSEYDGPQFNKITEVEVFCVKEIPNGDAQYIVEGVLTDNDLDVLLMTDIVCNVSGVKIEDKTITIPYNVRKDKSSITLTAKHALTGKTFDFNINFSKWNLVFEDNFNGNSLDTSKWTYCPTYPRDKGYANIWNNDMTFVKDGYLVSRAYNTGEQDTSGREWKNLVNPNDKTLYQSGAVWSKDLFESDYGYYEIYAKPHQVTGMWGAFWLITGDMDSGNAVDDNSAVNGAEIDIFESLKNLGINHAVHWDGWTGSGNSMPNKGYKGKDVFDGKFHTFALRWTPDEYVFLIDGEVTLRVEGYEAGGICKAKGYLNITTECGSWAGDMSLKKGEYSDMLVDYVRVYTTPSDK